MKTQKTFNKPKMAYSCDLADMDYHRLSWTIMDYYGLSWTVMDYHGLPWTIMDYHGLSWTILNWIFTYCLQTE